MYMKKNIILILIILLGTTLITFNATKKQVYDGDELYTYTLANSKINGFITQNIKQEEWNKSEDLKNAFALNNDEILSFVSIYKNQAGDVHPPFYYLIFHIASIISLNNFTILPGIIVNIISYIILMIYLYKISEQLLNKKEKYIPCILYTLSIGMLSTALFIRMYMMFSMFTVMFTYYFINKEKHPIKLALTTYLGFMTHYFFLIYAFFISLIYLIQQLINKNKENIIKYMKTIIPPVVLGFITFPFAYLHIFKGYRGAETQENLINSNILDNLKSIIEALNKEVFFIPILLLIAISLKKQKQKNPVLIITISTILYFIVTLKIIPIQSTRYFYAIYPIIILLIYYEVSIIKNQNKKISAVLVLISFAIITQIKYEPSWIGKQNKLNNKDKNIIYIIKNDYETIGDSQYLMSYDNIYYTTDQLKDYEIINNSEKDIVVKTDDKELIKRIIRHTKYKTYEEYEKGYILK